MTWKTLAQVIALAAAVAVGMHLWMTMHPADGAQAALIQSQTKEIAALREQLAAELIAKSESKAKETRSKAAAKVEAEVKHETATGDLGDYLDRVLPNAGAR